MLSRFILIQTSHAGNVGGVARAMKVMGFDDLVLVAPRWANVLRREETIQRASGANDVLAKARIVDTLDEALDGVSHLCATAMTPRDFGPPTQAPREHFSALLAPDQERPSGVAFLFGRGRVWVGSFIHSRRLFVFLCFFCHFELRRDFDTRLGCLLYTSPSPRD